MAIKKSGLIIVVVLLVLAAATVSAEVVGTFEIGTRYVDGTAFDPDTDILDVGESLYLSIYTDEWFVAYSTAGYFWALVCDPSLATITGGELGPDALGGGIGNTAGLVGVPGYGRAGIISPPPLHSMTYYPGLYLDNFLYTPQSAGDVTVSFWELDKDLFPYGVVDSVVISQVPEPVTITMLALGALLLRRRRVFSK